ncbi:F-box protein At5g07610-like, partial [Lotus japonicus]|uniref:F-box protein At5g07610-like n=1 Tax=Lotus japonicus TaxID=34305 RepID=UPI00258950B3
HPNILLRLPAKDVTRSKCVSKQWLSLISNPWFCHSHTHTSSPSSLWVRNSRIVSFTDQSQVRTYLPFDVDEIIKWSFEGPFTEIIQSCNGLLLCKSLLFDGRNTSMGCPYLVHNPVTDKFLLLPFPPKSDFYRVPEHDFEKIAAVYLDFDPLRSFYFKVISIVKLLIGGADSGKFRIYVYSSETHSWDKGEVFFTASPGMKIDSGVYCNGAIHWCTPGEVSMYFDVHEQCFKPLPEPSFKKTRRDACIVVKYFGEFKGNLYLVLTEGDSKLDFDVFKLKEDYSSWVLICHVDLNLARDGFFTNIPLFHVVCVVLEGNEEDWMIVFLVVSKMVSYNLKDHASRIVHEVDFITEYHVIGKSFHQYFETICNVP